MVLEKAFSEGLSIKIKRVGGTISYNRMVLEIQENCFIHTCCYTNQLTNVKEVFIGIDSISVEGRHVEKWKIQAYLNKIESSKTPKRNREEKDTDRRKQKIRRLIKEIKNNYPGFVRDEKNFSKTLQSLENLI